MEKQIYEPCQSVTGKETLQWSLVQPQELTLESKHDDPPLEVDIFIWLFPLSMSLSPSPTAEDGRLCEDMVGRLPEDERFLVKEELLPAPLFSFWYSMGNWRAAIAHRGNVWCPGVDHLL